LGAQSRIRTSEKNVKNAAVLLRIMRSMGSVLIPTGRPQRLLVDFRNQIGHLEVHELF
jgi:hypothetical protein